MSHALSSLRIHKTRNIGIALILAITVAIPTTVFAWTNTGTRLAVEDFLEGKLQETNKPSNPAHSGMQGR